MAGLDCSTNRVIKITGGGDHVCCKGLCVAGPKLFESVIGCLSDKIIVDLVASN